MIDRSEVEETLGQIPGVVSARVLGQDDEVQEVHVLSSGERHPKQIARDVESTLAARFALEIDHRRISVAQMDPVRQEETRLAVDSVLVKMKGQEAEIEVSLRLGGRTYAGRSRGVVSSRRRLVLVAAATGRAVEEALGGSVRVLVEDVGRYDVGGEIAIASLVILADGRREEVLVGSAYVRRDEAEACVRATLSGLNRRLGLYLEESPEPQPSS